MGSLAQSAAVYNDLDKATRIFRQEQRKCREIEGGEGGDAGGEMGRAGERELRGREEKRKRDGG